MQNKFKPDIKKKIIWLSIFAIAMAFLEAAMVIYLRKLYYPQGFAFPLNPFIEPSILAIEWLREICTIVMLMSMALIAGKSFYQKFAYFLYSFAIWDIFYYVFLKLILNWPVSFLTWDLLFLIPLPWASPILAPVICSLTMIIMAIVIIYLQNKNCHFKIDLPEWLLIFSGAFIIFTSFIWDYSKLIIQKGFFSNFWTLATNQDFQQIISQYVPADYNWSLFIIGQILILSALIFFYKKQNIKARSL
jgi:hypothetical protein